MTIQELLEENARLRQAVYREKHARRRAIQRRVAHAVLMERLPEAEALLNLGKEAPWDIAARLGFASADAMVDLILDARRREGRAA